MKKLLLLMALLTGIGVQGLVLPTAGSRALAQTAPPPVYVIPAPTSQPVIIIIPATTQPTQITLQPYHPKMAWGTNIEKNTPWSSSGAWCDITHQMTGWYSDGGGALTYDANDYPSAVPTTASAHTWLGGYPVGNYHLHYRVAKTLRVVSRGFQNVVQNADGSVDADLPISQWDVTINNGIGNFQLRVQADGPVYDLHIYAPDAVKGQTFRNAYLSMLKPYSCIRFLEWSRVNEPAGGTSAALADAKRIKVTGWDQTTRGVAAEFKAELCKEAGCDAWDCLPYLCDDSLVTVEAVAFRNVGIRVKMEYMNEPWNTTLGPQGMQIRNDAVAAGLYGQGDINQLGARRYATFAAHAGALFRQIMGPQNVQVVYNSQCADASWAANGLAYVPDGSFDVLAVAPYFQPTWSNNYPTGVALNKSVTVANILADCQTWTNVVLDPGLAANAAVAKQHGMAVDCYEGGQHLAPTTPFASRTGNWLYLDPALLAQSDPQMGVLYDNLFALCRRYQVNLFCHYMLIYEPTQYGFWGLYQYNGDQAGVKAQAVQRAMQG